jgi:hypothetical protein
MRARKRFDNTRKQLGRKVAGVVGAQVAVSFWRSARAGVPSLLHSPAAALRRRVRNRRDLVAELRESAGATSRLSKISWRQRRADQGSASLGRRSARLTPPGGGNLPYNIASPILFKLIELIDGGFR